MKLNDKESRNKLTSLLNKKRYFSEGNFLKVPIIEQIYLINNLDIEVGISKNITLKENLFTLFFCIINKIPMITFGKSGRSKSLAIKIIQSSMKALISKSLLCQKYPELLIFQINGTLITTPKNLLDIFEKANTYLNNNEGKLVVIFIKNMDIIESNQNNPLKVKYI